MLNGTKIVEHITSGDEPFSWRGAGCCNSILCALYRLAMMRTVAMSLVFHKLGTKPHSLGEDLPMMAITTLSGLLCEESWHSFLVIVRTRLRPLPGSAPEDPAGPAKTTSIRPRRDHHRCQASEPGRWLPTARLRAVSQRLRRARARDLDAAGLDLADAGQGACRFPLRCNGACQTLDCNRCSGAMGLGIIAAMHIILIGVVEEKERQGAEAAAAE
ncbi:uncharacterized protein PG986_013761 [Apiospora aurea]|uniref:Uncharacterized protein n=1 Tax=Apiospora aurea TaxID=335848 RepID=A0ABR1PWT9_9PEZI